MGLVATIKSLLGFSDEKKPQGKYGKGVTSDGEPIVTEAEKLQDEKNCAHVAKIFEGSALPRTGPSPENLNHLFKAWQMTQKKMFRAANKDAIAARNKMIGENRYNDLFNKVSFSDTPPGTDSSWKPFVMDAFTEPFPSTHDMDYWAMGTQTADILLLHGVGIVNAPNYYFHKKGHYVNHNMVQGIILFDLYKKG